MRKNILFFIIHMLPFLLFCQESKEENKLNLTGDLRIRVEQDWNSRKSNGDFRSDRTRLRYRMRFGMIYQYNDWFSLGARLRTGNPMKQQDPQLTFGAGSKEFGTLPLSFENLYAQYNKAWLSAWIGKNTYPFKKQNELFWSDNVSPEGLSLSGNFHFNNKLMNQLQINAGHFIAITNNESLQSDVYFQGIQLVGTFWNENIKLFPSFLYFSKMPDIPDGFGTYSIDYRILNTGISYRIIKSPLVTFGVNYILNLENYNTNDSIPQKLRNQKEGIVASLNIGDLKEKNDWKFRLCYARIERYAAVDYFAQNDWARWDYSSEGSADGRLTNFNGLEFNLAYAVDKNMNLKLRCFLVEQLISSGFKKETGNRIRIDLNVKF